MTEEKEEIERRFLIKRLPDISDKYARTEILQGYLAVCSDREVRIRRKNGEYFETLKIGSGRKRKEREPGITQGVFDELWPDILGHPIRYFVYDIPYNDVIINFEVFLDDFSGFYRAEVEFPNDEAAEKFVPPDWFGKEVTDDPRYNCRSIALNGLPEPEPSTPEKNVDDLPGIPRYALDAGIDAAVELINDKMLSEDTNIVVDVAGGSSSGKTSRVAAKLVEDFSPDFAEIRSLDNYYYGVPFMDEMARKGTPITWDDPRAVELSLARLHLLMAKKAQAVDEPVYDFKTGLRTGTVRKDPKRVIILEGLYTLYENLADIADVKIFVDIGLHGRMMRRLLRDVERVGKSPGEILKYFADVVEPSHEKFIEVTKKNADLIIMNEYNPYVEASRSGLHEIQVKFETKLDDEFLRKKGADRIGSIHQVDTYYNPLGLNLLERGEMIRIREENGYHILTYKGPKCDIEMCKRPKFEFPIDEETAKLFISMYGSEFLKIEKDRVLYQMGGVIIAQDYVKKISRGAETLLGNFVEIRSTDREEQSEEKVVSVAEALGLEMSNSTKKSYVEF
jgi:predicted adenylyl cyclase CyaB